MKLLVVAWNCRFSKPARQNIRPFWLFGMNPKPSDWAYQPCHWPGIMISVPKSWWRTVGIGIKRRISEHV